MAVTDEKRWDEPLAMSTLHFETQETGLQLCAQHCLNNLLQAPYFSAEDLGEWSRELDARERALLEGTSLSRSLAHHSMNADDTGFFSIQVINAALNVFDIQAEPIQSWDRCVVHSGVTHPREIWVAFLIHHDMHWFGLRRFGSTPACFRWVLFDSYKLRPDIVDPVHLPTKLCNWIQAKGSVLGIRAGTLPECEADRSGLWDIPR